MNPKPHRKLPGPIFAVMYGTEIRRERADGGEDFLQLASTQIESWKNLWLKKLFIILGETPVVDIHFGTVVLTHLQRKCRWGIFFSPWQFQLHLWFHWHLQETKLSDGDVIVRVPNSEDGIYARFPGWRWDLEEGMIPTGGRAPGAHWD